MSAERGRGGVISALDMTLAISQNVKQLKPNQAKSFGISQIGRVPFVRQITKAKQKYQHIKM